MFITDDPILTRAEAAQYCRRKPQTFAKYGMEGGGPRFIRLGTGPRCPTGYRKSELDRWLAERTYQSTAEETVARQAAAGQG